MHGAVGGRAPEGLIERDSELEALAGLLRGARGGEGGVALIEGPAGIGKSALLAAVVERARGAGMLAVSARGGELEREFGFGVVRQLFERELAGMSGSRRRSLLSGAARFAGPALDLTAGTGKEMPQAPDPFSVMHGLYWLAVNLSAEQAMLVCVDDAHWADLPSLRWLAYLARRLEGARVAVLIAARPAEVEVDAAGAVLAALRAGAAVGVLRPGALSESAVAALLESRLGVQGVPAFARACHEATAGNPFLVGELVRAIAAERLPADETSVERLRGLAPEGVSAAVLLRLSRLSPEARAVALAVGVLEPHAEQRYVSELTGLDGAACAVALDALRAAEILAGDHPLAFVHPLIRAAVGTQVGAAERARIHNRAARVLADAGAGAELVATHLGQTVPDGDEWVVEVLTEAATLALARGAPRVAVAHWRRALDEPPDPARRGGVLIGLGEAEFAVEDPQCADHLREAMLSSRNAEERVTAALLLGQAAVASGQASVAREAVQAARRDRVGDPELEHMLDTLSLMALNLGGGAPQLEDRLERLGRELTGASPAERTLLSRLALTKVALGHSAPEVISIAEKSLEDGALDLDHPDMFGAQRAGIVLAYADQLERADRLQAISVERWREAGMLPRFGLATATRAHTQFRLGDLAGAEISAEDALRASDAAAFSFW
ncbi:MAG: AAA family ATPase, partial [Solirubrobacterales bacterium]|nr:AAA family ATPase [Solirubrobacterales bacterium]